MKLLEQETKTTPICGLAKIGCHEGTKSYTFEQESSKSFRDNCNCLSSCTIIKYETEIDRMKYDKTDDNATGEMTG